MTSDEELIARVREAFEFYETEMALNYGTGRAGLVRRRAGRGIAALDTLARRLQEDEETLRTIASHERPEDAYVLDTAMRLWKRSAAEYFQELARKSLLHPEPPPLAQEEET
jgi:hypothetical protein